MKNKNRQNLGWCLNDERLKEHTIKLRYGLRGVPIMTNHRKKLQSGRKDEKPKGERINFHQT